MSVLSQVDVSGFSPHHAAPHRQWVDPDTWTRELWEGKAMQSSEWDTPSSRYMIDSERSRDGWVCTFYSGRKRTKELQEGRNGTKTVFCMLMFDDLLQDLGSLFFFFFF
ncbi:unnamed protein product [Musa hybrid cultivar]